MNKSSLLLAIFLTLTLTPLILGEEQLPVDNNAKETFEEPALPVINNEPEMPEVEGGITGKDIHPIDAISFHVVAGGAVLSETIHTDRPFGTGAHAPLIVLYDNDEREAP